MLPLFDSETPRTLVERVYDALRYGATVITANARAARSLRFLYAGQQRTNGLEMWATPQILDWDAWLANLWRELALADPNLPLLLTTLQEHFLWKRVQQIDAQLVVSPDGMASLAQSAYALLSHYRLHDTRKSAW
ncbi:MAG TPA: hypothetical protein VHT24_08440, partial [Pseudacidobacterium sp.]|nr:hypothetical protein [Pseudacidobacterium sp.]